MKQTVSNQMGDGQIVKEGNDIPTSYDNFILHDLEKIAENEPLSIIQAIFYACLGGFSIQEVLEVQK